MLTDDGVYINFMENDNILPSKEQMEIIDKQAEEAFNQMTPMVYIDGFTHFMDWKE